MIWIPKQLQKEEIRFVLLKRKDKAPFEKNWTISNYRYDDEKLLKWLDESNNYGVIGGFGNLIIIDFDNKEFQEKIIPYLPKTFTVKTGGGGLHKYFITDEPKSFKILDDKKNTLADIQGIGKQVVAPNSIHPNGNNYLVLDNSNIAKLSFKSLQLIFKDYIKKKDSFRPDYDEDEITKIIKGRLSIPDLMGKAGYDLTRNPTMCMLGHDSKGKKCFSYNDNLWYCFHCDEGGDIFNFVMAHNNCNFIEAKKKLMKILGIETKETSKYLLKITNYIENVKCFYKIQPFFYDKSGMFWFWRGNKWEIVDDIDVMNAIDKELSFGGETVTSGVKNNYLEAFKRVGRIKIPKDAPKTWVQFKDKIFDIKTQKIFNATSEYFICNPIPWKLGKSNKTPIIYPLLVFY
jgi:hypothetical protein